MQPAKSMRQTIQLCKQKFVFILIAVLAIVHSPFVVPLPGLANTPSLDWAQAHLNGIVSEQQILEQAKQTFNARYSQIEKVLSEQEIREQAKKFANTAQIQFNKMSADKHLVAQLSSSMNMPSGTFCKAYKDSLEGINSAAWDAIVKSAGVIFTIAQSTPSASVAGAGNVVEFAGISSAVSQMGLGEVMTAIAGLMGSDVAGTSAIALVTSAVGGPVIMGAILAGGTIVTTYGTYKLGQFTAERFGSWAGEYCSTVAMK